MSKASVKKPRHKAGKIRVVLECDNPHAPDTSVNIGLLLRDALEEFAANRESSDYVLRRYEGRSDEWAEQKRAEVKRRIAVAEALRCGIKSIDYT